MAVRSFRRTPLVAAAVLMLGAASCDDPPTAPTGGTTMAITAVTPESPVSSPTPQTVLVQGRNFLSEVFVSVKAPDATERVFSGADIQNRQISSFQVNVVLPQTGAYELRVGPSPVIQSAPFPLIVRATQTTPVIYTVTPSAVVRGVALQSLRFDGVDFDPNLTLTLTAPDGVVTVLSGPQLAAVTATSVQVNLVFNKVGAHTFVITNSSGESSNPVQVDAT
jgi:hypothetical protein